MSNWGDENSHVSTAASNLLPTTLPLSFLSHPRLWHLLQHYPIWSMQVKTLKLILMMILSKQIILINSVKEQELLCLCNLFSYKLECVFCLITRSLFFHFNPPSCTPSFLVPISVFAAGPYPQLSAHPSFSHHPSLPPQSLPSSPFCASCFSFPSTSSSSSPGLSSTFPVRSKHHVHLFSFLTCEQREPLTWLTFNVACMAANAFTSFILLQFRYT